MTGSTALQLATLDDLDPSRPLSLVLGAGGIRGLAHLGVLETLERRGFSIAEMVGTSVGALIIAFYAAVGLDVDEIAEIGRSLTSRHLLAWAWLSRAPNRIRERFAYRAGPIPGCIAQLAETHWSPLHHDVERIGLVAYDARRGQQIVAHNRQVAIRVVDAARGAAALPGLFVKRRVRGEGRDYLLVDGGVVNRLPVSVLFAPPFAPQQVLAVDISNTGSIRQQNLEELQRLQAAHTDVPICALTPDTLRETTVFYRRKAFDRLVAAGRRAASS